jgi:hypothetical protein
VAFADWQCVIEIGGIRQIAHAELVKPLERTRAALAANYNIDMKPLRVHNISLASSAGTAGPREVVSMKMEPTS